VTKHSTLDRNIRGIDLRHSIGQGLTGYRHISTLSLALCHNTLLVKSLRVGSLTEASLWYVLSNPQSDDVDHPLVRKKRFEVIEISASVTINSRQICLGFAGWWCFFWLRAEPVCCSLWASHRAIPVSGIRLVASLSLMSITEQQTLQSPIWQMSRDGPWWAIL
jgi:hypothetical protein